MTFAVPVGFQDVTTQIQNLIGPTLEILVGTKFRDVHVTPPSVKIFPSPSNFSQTDQAGYGVSPNLIQSMKQRIEVHCWGDDYDSADILFYTIFTALHQAASSGRAQIIHMERFDEAIDTVGIVTAGIMEWDTYILEQKLPLVYQPNKAGTVKVPVVPDTSQSRVATFPLTYGDT